MNQTRYNARSYNGTKWSGEEDEDGDGYSAAAAAADDPDEVQLDGDDDGENFPPPGRNSPANFSLLESSFSLCCFRPRRDGGIILRLPVMS